MRVAVIGGGIIGLSSAYHLARAGHAVTLIERNTCGRGASWGNAGWIVPSLIAPFNAPGAVPQALRAMLNPQSPIALRQLPTLSLARWGLRFLHQCSPDRSRAALRILAGMSADASADILALADDLGFEVHRAGLLIPFRSPAALAEYRAAHAVVESAGYRGPMEVLDARSAAEREPALSPDVVGAAYLPDEISVRPDAMTTALADGLATLGGEIVEDETVVGVGHTGRGWQVRTPHRSVDCDVAVIAAGEQTAALARSCGVRLPLQSARGCSITLPPVLELRGPVKIAEDRVACTPFANGELRISGTFDLVRPGAGTSRGRMQAVLAAASATLPALRDLDISALGVWSGARTCTPDSIPVVGPVGRRPGLIVASGHGTLGMTLSAATARTVTALVNATSIRHSPRGIS
ncbi:NAD(P)/FAD-dependent oxidoreductase [Mycolicibacterium vaccae]|uniref:NAD(P)/FAD-dependent oxidoreductase n=1 Tax=Mycolicibacterium vaccae TaxID=1810 RepID=UPI003CFC3353